MQMMDVDKLVPHEKNNYFFDDMSGEAWMAFLESIETSGIIEPIIITEGSHTIISGHQRVRAAKHFKMKQVPVAIREYVSDDEVLKQLIETNIRQRGIGNTNPVKLMRCEKELERIYGIRNGSAGKVAKEGLDGTKFAPKTQAQLAEELGVSPKHWQNIKNIEKLAPEVQDMLERGQVTESAVRGLYKVLTPEQQKAFAEEFSDKDKVTAKKVSQYVEQIKAASEENERLRKIVSEKEAENVRLKNQKQKVREVERIVEKVPDDYDVLKKKAKQADAYRKDFDNERQKTADERRKNLELQDRIAELEQRSASGELHTRVVEGSLMFISGCGGFLRDYGGYVWIAEHLNELNQTEQENYKKAVESVYAWSQNLLEAIKRERSMNNE